MMEDYFSVRCEIKEVMDRLIAAGRIRVRDTADGPWRVLKKKSF